MDDFLKTLVTTAVGGALTIAGLGISKGLDYWASIAKEKRDFAKYRRERIHAEIEELKDSLGKIYELSNNWVSYDLKLEEYYKTFEHDYEIIGRYNKYPDIVSAARDVVHWCKVVAYCERSHHDELIKSKKQLAELYKDFLQTCDRYLDQLP